MGKRKVVEDSDDEDSTDGVPPHRSPPKNSEYYSSIRLENGIVMAPDDLQHLEGLSTASTGPS